MLGLPKIGINVRNLPPAHNRGSVTFPDFDILLEYILPLLECKKMRAVALGDSGCCNRNTLIVCKFTVLAVALLIKRWVLS